MALDTRNDRASAILPGLFWRNMLPEPAGAIDVNGRYMIAGLYAGFASIVNVLLTGVSVTGTLDDVAVSIQSSFSISGLTMTAALGDLTTSASATALLTSVLATTVLGNLLVWGPVPPGPSGNWSPVLDGPAGGWTSVSSGPSGGWTPVVT